MDVSDPFSAVCPSLDGPVLSVLAGTSRALSARDVSRLVRRGSWSGVRRTLHRLAAQGVARVDEVGGAQLYTLNRRHVAAPAVEILVDLRSELIRRLGASLESWAIPPRHASLFGSVARGDGDIESDVDLFVVRPARVATDDPTWRAQLETLAADVYDWTGNRASISEVGPNEVAKAGRSAAGKAIRDEGILLTGTAVRQLFKRRRAA